MMRSVRRVIAVIPLVATAGCATVVAAPGADQVRLTQNPADVAGCTAMGNIKVGPDDQGLAAAATFRNSVVGFGGNTGLITQAVISAEPIEGIAYRCPSAGTAGAK
jgi:hypothetical protein